MQGKSVKLDIDLFSLAVIVLFILLIVFGVIAGTKPDNNCIYKNDIIYETYEEPGDYSESLVWVKDGTWEWKEFVVLYVAEEDGDTVLRWCVAER